jgi:hypothetical protein
MDARLTEVAGGLSVALARTIRIIDTERRHALTPDWERAFRIADLLL